MTGQPHGSPAWHAEQAAEHLAAADALAARAVTDGDAAAAVTRRLLAATANAQLGSLKLALELDALLVETRQQLANLSETATWFYNRAGR